MKSTGYVCLLAAVTLWGQDVRQGIELRDHDQPAEALEIFRAAMAKDPRDVRAFAEYVRTKSYDLDQYDDVRFEFEERMRKEPDNWVYPMARYEVAPFAQEHGLKFPVLFDGGAAELYKVNSYPTSLLIDRDGMLRLRFNIAEKRSLDAMLSMLL